MISASHYFEVRKSVVGAIVIFMMNNFRARERATKIFFHDETMLPDVSTVCSQVHVTGSNNPFVCFFQSAFVRRVAAIIGTILRGISIRPHFKLLLASVTLNRDQMFLSPRMFAANVRAMLRAISLDAFYPSGIENAMTL